VRTKKKLTPREFQTLLMVANGINTTTELAKGFGVSRPTVAGWLKRLKQSGLVDVVLRDGKYTYYCATGRAFKQPCPTCGKPLEEA